MSCGTPVGGGGFMRQRHSQGYTSSGDDLEDDACSTATSPAAPVSRTRTWFEVVENVLWVCSAVFVVYFGDRKSNLLYLLCFDDRIRRIPLYIAIVGLILNFGIFFYMSVLAWGMRKSDEELEVLTPSVAPFVTLLGMILLGSGGGFLVSEMGFEDFDVSMPGFDGWLD
ncbi:hypothetical protein Sjap_019218 [Stephania japonica]|uniref:Transmembrane protein 128 n=1 Tax=Stephania japonica TaxID=461633 RepID=A0AAP0F791_9MAGN